MTLATAVVGLSLVLEDTDLAFLTLFKDLACYLGTCYVGLANLDVISGNQKNFIKSYFSAFFNVQFFDGNNLAFFNNVLFSTGFDNKLSDADETSNAIDFAILRQNCT